MKRFLTITAMIAAIVFITSCGDEGDTATQTDAAKVTAVVGSIIEDIIPSDVSFSSIKKEIGINTLANSTESCDGGGSFTISSVNVSTPCDSDSCTASGVISSSNCGVPWELCNNTTVNINGSMTLTLSYSPGAHTMALNGSIKITSSLINDGKELTCDVRLTGSKATLGISDLFSVSDFTGTICGNNFIELVTLMNGGASTLCSAE